MNPVLTAWLYSWPQTWTPENPRQEEGEAPRPSHLLPVTMAAWLLAFLCPLFPGGAGSSSPGPGLRFSPP